MWEPVLSRAQSRSKGLRQGREAAGAGKHGVSGWGVPANPRGQGRGVRGLQVGGWDQQGLPVGLGGR